MPGMMKMKDKKMMGGGMANSGSMMDKNKVGMSVANKGGAGMSKANYAKGGMAKCGASNPASGKTSKK
jgi:hypothetical protein